MQDKRLPRKGPQVKRNPGSAVAKKLRRAIPKGVALTNADIKKVAERYKWSMPKALTEIKREYENLVNRYPGLTSPTKRVAIKLGWWYMPDKRFARAAIPTIAKELDIGHATVSRALKPLHEQQIVFTQSGGPSRPGSLGPTANKYVPDLGRVIDRDTGKLLKYPDYNAPARERMGGLKSSPHSEVMKSSPHSEVGVKRSNPRGCQESSPHSEVEYSSTSADANASPASADATASYAPAPREDQIGPLPEHDSDSVKIRFAQVKDLAYRSGVDSGGLIQLFKGKGTPAAMIGLQGICKREIFNFGKPTFGTLDHNRPNHGIKLGRVIVHEGEGRITFIEDGIALADLTPDSRLVIEYQVSPEYQIEAQAKVKELRGEV